MRLLFAGLAIALMMISGASAVAGAQSEKWEAVAKFSDSTFSKDANWLNWQVNGSWISVCAGVVNVRYQPTAIRLSQDGGKTWQSPLASLNSCSFSVFRSLWVSSVAGLPHDLATSKDGISWKEVPNSPCANGTRQWVVQQERLYVVCDKTGGLFSIGQIGESWQTVAAPNYDSWADRAITTSVGTFFEGNGPLKGHYQLLKLDGVLHGLDSGMSPPACPGGWTYGLQGSLLTGSSFERGSFSRLVFIPDSWVGEGVACDESTVVFAIKRKEGGSGLILTRDRGLSWEMFDGLPPGVIEHKTDGGYLYVLTSEGVLRRRFSGASGSLARVGEMTPMAPPVAQAQPMLMTPTAPATLPSQFALVTCRFQPASVQLGKPTVLEATLNQPAPAGGLTVPVDFASDGAATTFGPQLSGPPIASLKFAQGATIASAPLQTFAGLNAAHNVHVDIRLANGTVVPSHCGANLTLQ